VDGKDEGQGGDGLLSAGQVVHGPETLPGRDAVVSGACRDNGGVEKR